MLRSELSWGHRLVSSQHPLAGTTGLKGKLLGRRSLRMVESGPGGGRRKAERFKPAAEMGREHWC